MNLDNDAAYLNKIRAMMLTLAATAYVEGRQIVQSDHVLKTQLIGLASIAAIKIIFFYSCNRMADIARERNLKASLCMIAEMGGILYFQLRPRIKLAMTNTYLDFDNPLVCDYLITCLITLTVASLIALNHLKLAA